MMEHLREMWKTARGGTVLYRGMHLSVSLDKMVRDGARAAIDSVLRAAQEPARYGDTGIGVHWTESLDTAKDFAWQIGYDNYMAVHYPYEGNRGAFSFVLPIVLVAKPAMGSIRTDDKVRDQYRMTDIGQTDPDYGTSVFESEIPVAHGGEIRLESIIVAMPSAEIIQRYVAMPAEKRPGYDKVISKNLTSHWSWVEVRAPLKIKASREVPGVWLNERPGSQGHECSDACILPVRKTASMKDRAYRGVPLKLDAGQGVPILQALVKGQRNVAARLIIDAMAMRAMDKAHWWAIGDQPHDEAGRWWTSSKEAAYQYSLGQYSENWMTMPVVMTAEFSEANDSAREDGQGAWWWHLPAGHPLTIVKFEAALPDDPQALLDGWNGISSPGNFDHPIGVDGDFVDLPIPPMRTTARIH